MSTSRACAALGLMSLLAPALAVAQTDRLPPVTWEYIGLPDITASHRSAFALEFKRGGDESGLEDTLYAAFFSREDLSRLTLNQIGAPGGPPVGAPWTVDLHPSPEKLLVTAAGSIIATARAGPITIHRSTDGGITWSDDPPDIKLATCAYQRPGGRGLVACGLYEPDPGNNTARFAALVSRDDGATWTAAGFFPTGVDNDSTLGSEANAIAELARAAPGGRPRLVAGVYNGIAVSDDDGATWRRTPLWGPYRWYINGFAQATPASPAALGTASAAQALGDTLFACGRDFLSGRPVVLASADGVAWTLRHTFDVYADPRLEIGPDGALWVGTPERASARWPVVLSRSGDGGRTWTPAQDGYDAYQGVTALQTGRDGRMYLAGGVGVWRTRSPIVAVAAAPAAPRRAGVSLSVRPNPAVGRVEVVLRVAEAQPVRVTVVDALGREVAVVLDGPVAAGERIAGVETASWPAGVYVVRATAGVQTATARLVVAR